MYATTSTIHQQSESFDIRNFIDRLTPTKEKNRYECPVCGGHNLTIDPKTGKYKCWNGCECKDIRDTIAPLPDKERFTPWAERQQSYQSQPSTQAKASTRSKPKPPPIPEGVKLTTLNAPATDIPQPQPQPLTKKLKGIPRSATETIYNYSYLTKPVTEIENSATKVEESVTEVEELATETGETIAEAREPVRDLRFNVPIRFWTILIDFNWLASILFLRQTLTEIGQPMSEAGESETEVRKPDTKPAGLPSQWVVRYEWEDLNSIKGRDKTFRQWHRLPDGTPSMKKGDKPWRAYRLEEAIAAAKLITSGIPAMLWQEGEKCVEIARKIAIASLTMQGSAWGKADIERNLTEIKTEVPLSVQVLLADADKTGQKKAQTFYDACTELGMPCVIVFPSDICGDLPDNANDIEQILAHMDTEQFIRRLEASIHASVDAKTAKLQSEETQSPGEMDSPFEGKGDNYFEGFQGRQSRREMGSPIETGGNNYSEGSEGTEPRGEFDSEDYYHDIAAMLGLNPYNCCTAKAFDLWVLEQIFGLKDWRAFDQSLYQWSDDQKYWKLSPDADVIRLVATAGQKAYKLVRDKTLGWLIKRPYGTNSNKESAFKYIRSYLEVPSQERVANTHLLGFKNCAVNLKTREQFDHDRSFYITNIVPYDYKPNAECPEVFSRFVTESFGAEMLEVIRAFTCMFLDPTAPYGRFPHIIGQSGGGKGTLIRLWGSIFGEDGYGSANKFADLATAEGRHQYLTGKRIFAFPDMGGYVNGVRAFYELVDNGSMTGRPLYSSTSYSKRWNVRFAIASVDHLQIENAGDGWERRTYPIPVISRSVDKDPELETKLNESIADIISWALAMPKEERDRILLAPPANERSQSLVRDAALYGDSTRSFVDLCLRPCVSDVHIPSYLLHSWYVAYCQQHGYTPLSQTKFISHLKTVLPRNFVDRKWGEQKDGKRDRIPAHWASLNIIPEAFQAYIPGIGNTSYVDPASVRDDTEWKCIKSRCIEGGLYEFEDFWQGTHPLVAPYQISNQGANQPANNGLKPLESLPRGSVQGVQSIFENKTVCGQAKTFTQSECPKCPPCPNPDLTNEVETNGTQRKIDGTNGVNGTNAANVVDLEENLDSNVVDKWKIVPDTVDSMDTRSGKGVHPLSNVSTEDGHDGQTVNQNNSQGTEAPGTRNCNDHQVTTSPETQTVLSAETQSNNVQLQPMQQVVSNQPESATLTNPEIAENTGNADTQSIRQQIFANWDNILVLGKLILAIADTEILLEAVRNLTNDQINHLKNAAKQVWKPGCDSKGEYCGEKVELMEFGNKHDWKVRSANGSLMPAARGNVRPWLGI
jgi:putative DNA primase/helicase